MPESFSSELHFKGALNKKKMSHVNDILGWKHTSDSPFDVLEA